MPGGDCGVALKDIEPRPEVEMIAIRSFASEGRVVIGEDVGTALPEEVGPVAGSGADLDERGLSRDGVDQVRFGKDVRIALGELQTVRRIVAQRRQVLIATGERVGVHGPMLRRGRADHFGGLTNRRAQRATIPA